MLVAAFDRIRKGKTIIDPDPSLSHAANFLWMLHGEKPIPAATNTFDIALILHADHEFNASTFAARVIAGTMADMHSAITGAIGALKGPLHGGANEAVMKMLFEIGKAGERSRRACEQRCSRKRKKSSASAIASIAPKIPAPPTCAACREQLSRDSGNTQVVRDVPPHRGVR